jgi:uncharacterized protein YxeA
MRKILVAVVAILVLVGAGLFVATPRITADAHLVSASMGIDIGGLTQRARDMAAETYPAH